MSGRSIVVASLLAGLIAGCASVPMEMPPDSVRHHELSTVRLLSEGVGVVGDGCIGGMAMAGSVAYQEESVDYAGVALTRFSKFLVTQGIKVHRQVLPLLCGQLVAGASELRVAEDADSNDQAMTPPVIVNEHLRRNPRLALAYSELLGAAARIGPTAITQAATEVESSLDLSADTVAALRQELGSPLVFVATVRGTQVSGPRKWTTAIATGVASLAISGGTFVQISTNETVHRPRPGSGRSRAPQGHVEDGDRRAQDRSARRILSKAPHALLGRAYGSAFPAHTAGRGGTGEAWRKSRGCGDGGHRVGKDRRSIGCGDDRPQSAIATTVGRRPAGGQASDPGQSTGSLDRPCTGRFALTANGRQRLADGTPAPKQVASASPNTPAEDLPWPPSN